MFRRRYYIKKYKSPNAFVFCKVTLADVYLVLRGPLLHSKVDGEDGSSKNKSKGE